MKNVISIYDVSSSLTLLVNNPLISLAIIFVYFELFTSIKTELAVVVCGLISATAIKNKHHRVDILGAILQLFVLAVYQYNFYIGVLMQCGFDYIVWPRELAKSRALLRFILLIFIVLFTQNTNQQIVVCFLISILHAFGTRLK